ncbi:hypothetical protein ACEQ8H_008225 [Pleosporales sp. CAS-2024a]
MVAAHVALFSLAALARSSGAWTTGQAFDRLAILWLENTDYALAAGDASLGSLALRGIRLTNYFAVTHPSQANYAASLSGDYYGLDHDDEVRIPAPVSTLVDLLEDKGVRWAVYEEDMPSVGFAGNTYRNPITGANMYVRKHNPAILYDSVALQAGRTANIKPLTQFYADLEAEALPQWIFITPNSRQESLTSDGHDSTVTVAGTWTRNFLEPLLNNTSFMNRTLVIVTFDENHSYAQQNRVVALLLGDAVPTELIGTTDSSYYNHYSAIATAQANWGLFTLGRWDVGANVFAWVAAKTGDRVRAWSGNVPLSSTFFNASYAGPLNQGNTSVPWPVPNSQVEYAGRRVLPSIAALWGQQIDQSAYTCALEIPDGQHPDAEFRWRV